MGIRSDLLAATRRALCETALRLFVQQGIAATKMEDILKASDVSVGSFFITCLKIKLNWRVSCT